MKTMTCAKLGGMCEAPISAATEEEMMMNGMKHLEEAHPEMAASVKAMPAEDPKMVAWVQKFKEDYASTPEDAPAAA